MKRAFRIAALALALCLPLAGQATADQFDDATATYESVDYATALRLLHPHVEQGVALAQYNLGYMYTMG